MTREFISSCGGRMLFHPLTPVVAACASRGETDITLETKVRDIERQEFYSIVRVEVRTKGGHHVFDF